MKILVTDADEQLKTRFGAALSAHEIVYTADSISEDFVRQHSDAECLCVFVSSGVTAEIIDLLPSLRHISTRSTGVDHIDVPHAKSRGIVVTNVARYGAHTVAEFAFALLLSLSRRIPEGNRRLREEGEFSTAGLNGFDLFGKTIGVIGTGAIGRNVVRIAQGFGMQVRMFDLSPDTSIETADARYAAFDDVLASSDILSLHVPHTAENHHLLNAETLARAKHGVRIVNTARGELIDAQALLAALESGQVAGAALDVLEGEREYHAHGAPLHGAVQENSARSNPLVMHPHVIVTPHIAFFSDEAYREILDTTLESIASFVSGTPQHTV